jgi:hypothetical protein
MKSIIYKKFYLKLMITNNISNNKKIQIKVRVIKIFLYKIFQLITIKIYIKKSLKIKIVF